MPTATAILASLDKPRSRALEKIIVNDSVYTAFRKAARTALESLNQLDDQAAGDMAAELRVTLLESLTSPVDFDDQFLSRLAGAYGSIPLLSARWGGQIAARCKATLDRARELVGRESPVRTVISERLAELESTGASYKIFCHRRARQYYLSLREGLSHEHFLHTSADYASCEIFDILVKMGPFRRYGWSSAPQAIVNAPRFSLLLQIVWSQSSDEETFGIDPVLAAIRQTPTSSSPWSCWGWEQSRRVIGEAGRDETHKDDNGRLDVASDEFSEKYSPLRCDQVVRRCVMLQIGADQGILNGRKDILTFDPSASEAKAGGFQRAGLSLGKGMFLVLPKITRFDLGSINFSRSRYSAAWKKRLSDELQRDANGLVSRLREAGLDLKHLAGALRSWCRPPDNVIHGPQTREHFRILLKALDLGPVDRLPQDERKWIPKSVFR
jgi:hypothetical protein